MGAFSDIDKHLDQGREKIEEGREKFDERPEKEQLGTKKTPNEGSFVLVRVIRPVQQQQFQLL